MNARISTLFLFSTLLLTACTDYYEEFENSYGYGKSSKGYELEGSTLTDLRDGKTYNIAHVGNLYWMLDNVAYKFYRNHDEKDKADCPRPSESTCLNTGFLYAATRLDYVCPKGWRLPTADEWKEFYNSSAFQNYTLDNEVYKGYLNENRNLQEDGNAAYFWTDAQTDGGGGRECVVFSKSDNLLRTVGPFSENSKLAVRCVLDADSYNPDSGSGSPEDGGSEQNKNEFDCSVTDGVKVVYPEGGEAFKVGETIKLVFGSDMDFGGFGVELRFNEGVRKVNLLDHTIDDAVIDGEACNEYSIKLDAELGVVAADDAYIYVYPYSKQSKAGRSEIFKVYSDSPIVKEPTQSQEQSSSSYSSSSETLCDPVTAHLVSLSNNMSTSQTAINFETGLADNPHVTLKIMNEEAFFIPGEGVTIYEDNSQVTGLEPEPMAGQTQICREGFTKSVRTYDEELISGLWLDVVDDTGKIYPVMIKKAMFESSTKGLVDIVYYN